MSIPQMSVTISMSYGFGTSSSPFIERYTVAYWRQSSTLSRALSPVQSTRAACALIWSDCFPSGMSILLPSRALSRSPQKAVLVTIPLVTVVS